MRSLWPSWHDFSELDDFLRATDLWADYMKLAAYWEGDRDAVGTRAGMPLHIIAALKARTVARTWKDLYTLIMEGGLEPGDTRSFGAVPLIWTDPLGETHELIAAGTGGHPVFDRTAALQVRIELDLVTAELNRWLPMTAKSETFVLTERTIQGELV